MSDEQRDGIPADPDEHVLPEPLRKRLKEGDLSFHDFVEAVLYDPEWGYYSTPGTRANRSADYATSVTISPAFGFALARLADEFVERSGDGLSGIVDIGCGDGSLLAGIAGDMTPALRERVTFFGIDRAAARSADRRAEGTSGIVFGSTIEVLPPELPLLILSNELFDAFPFARVVQRDDGLHELYVHLADDGTLDWTERPAPQEYVRYFAERQIRLETGQFADVTPEWGRYYNDVCARVRKAVVVTFDYGFPQRQLFDVRIRRYGTAAAYFRHGVHRDLLARPGRQDLTAHVNFTDLERAGEAAGAETLLFTRQARFLLSIGILDSPLLRRSLQDVTSELVDVLPLADASADARRLVLPDGIGEDIRVLVQAKNHATTGWSFLRNRF